MREEDFEVGSTLYGWICPRCGAVNAPWLIQCNCSSRPIYSASTDLKDFTNRFIENDPED